MEFNLEVEIELIQKSSFISEVFGSPKGGLKSVVNIDFLIEVVDMGFDRM